MSKKLPKQKTNFSEWYTQLVKIAGLADYGPVKGTMVIKPYGFQLWDNIKDSFDKSISVKSAKKFLALGPEIDKTAHCSVTDVQKTFISNHSVCKNSSSQDITRAAPPVVVVI